MLDEPAFKTRIAPAAPSDPGFWSVVTCTLACRLSRLVGRILRSEFVAAAKPVEPPRKINPKRDAPLSWINDHRIATFRACMRPPRLSKPNTHHAAVTNSGNFETAVAEARYGYAHVGDVIE
jgi:hypothetical protein